MNVKLHPHALIRLAERGASESEVIETVRSGKRFAAKYGRTGFRRNFAFGAEWMGRYYLNKRIEAFAVWEDDAWLVITVLVKFY